MIFVTVGSQKFQFDRLLRSIDEQIASGKIKEEIFAQIGFSTYKPKNYAFADFLDREDFGRWVRDSEIVITHGGTGAIVGTLKKGKKVIAVPRLAKFGEHVDDHQLQIIGQFGAHQMICACYEPEKLYEAIIKARQTGYVPYQSNTGKFIDNIRAYINKL
ncbi:MAG: PssE/Cps14G family polysaccharide biosynthesis glycosyltransferase [bacterium]